MLASLFVFLSYILAATARWLNGRFNDLTIDQILFHLNVPIDAEGRLIRSYLFSVVLVALVIALVFYFVIARRHKKKAAWQEVLYNHRWGIAGVFAVFCFIYCCVKLQVQDMWAQYQRFQQVSTYFDDNYINPEEVRVEFPKKKRNLIVIFMESMDTSHLQSKHYDYFKTNLTPELQKLARENINFSDNDDIGGAIQVRGAHFTQAGLTAQYCGLPLRLPIKASQFRPDKGFLPAAKCLSDFLKEQGYEQTLVNGMIGSYGGLDKFLETHGGVRLLDTRQMRAENLLRPEDYSEGIKIVKDASLLEISKKEIKRLAAGDKPFAFTVMTIDTHLGLHFFDTEHCKARFDDEDPHSRYKNIFSCQSKLLGEFVDWIKAQPFYENTTVVMLDDHLIMYDIDFSEGMEGKRILNIFLNPAQAPENSKNRTFLSFDIYPTILEAIGAKVDGGRLGLGTSLYRSEPTLAEREGDVRKIDESLDMRSKLYEKMLYGKIIGEE